MTNAATRDSTTERPITKSTTYSRTETFQQARWNEPILFEMDSALEQGIVVNKPCARVEESVTAGESALVPKSMQRKSPPPLPRLGQMQVLKHYVRLSQQTLGADVNVDVGQGTCTIKYSPKVNEQLVRMHKLADVHPLQDASTIQGSLEMIHKADLFCREISGMDRFSFHPRSGTHALLAMASMVRAYHEERGEAEQRDEVVTTMFSHPSDAAAAHVLGYKITSLDQDDVTGMVDIEAFRSAITERTAAVFITNPEDTGIFNPQIKEFTDIVHEKGGVCCYDQANANGILGITRAREAGFDMCFFNLHKTFSIPHACGGPACGGLGVKERFEKYMPKPIVDFDGTRYFLDDDRPHSIGNIGSFQGVVPAPVRAYAWMMSLGAEGLKKVAQIAALNNNYLLHHIKQIPGASAPYTDGKPRIEQVRYSWQKLFEDTGVSTDDVTRRMCDHGMHMWSSHHPFIRIMSLTPHLPGIVPCLRVIASASYCSMSCSQIALSE